MNALQYIQATVEPGLNKKTWHEELVRLHDLRQDQYGVEHAARPGEWAILESLGKQPIQLKFFDGPLSFKANQAQSVLTRCLNVYTLRPGCIEYQRYGGPNRKTAEIQTKGKSDREIAHELFRKHQEWSQGNVARATVEPGHHGKPDMNKLKAAVRNLPGVKHAVAGTDSSNEYVKLWFTGDCHVNSLHVQPDPKGLHVRMVVLYEEYFGILRDTRPSVFAKRVEELVSTLQWGEGRTTTQIQRIAEQAMKRFCR